MGMSQNFNPHTIRVENLNIEYRGWFEEKKPSKQLKTFSTDMTFSKKQKVKVKRRAGEL